MVTIVDPPAGWKYGFPRECPDRVWKSDEAAVFRTWLVESGYPEDEVDFGMKYIRCWEHHE